MEHLQMQTVVDFPSVNSALVARPAEVIEMVTELGFVLPTEEEVEISREIAARMIHPNIAQAEQFMRVERHSGVGMLVYKEQGHVTGMMAMIMLNRHGHDAIRQGTFDPIEPDLDHLCKSNDPLVAGYGWGFAATTKLSGRSVVGAFDHVRRKLFSTIPIYTRAATEDGERIVKGFLGYEDVPWEDDSGLIWLPGCQEQKK